MSNQVSRGAAQEDVAIVSWVRLLRGYAEIRRQFNGSLQREHGLSINDYEVLLHLSRADDRRLRRVDLAERVNLTASGVTRLLDGLQDEGWVEKHACPDDARVTWAKLTDQGLSKLTDASASHIESVRAFFEDRYGAEELAALAELLGRLPGTGGEDPAACSPP